MTSSDDKSCDVRNTDEHNDNTDRPQQSPSSMIMIKNCRNFPSRLYQFLDTFVPENDIAHIIAWQSHGRCFKIHKPKEFDKINFPSWFQFNKYSSFQRQLHIYGFQRITSGMDQNSYYHEFFIRGQFLQVSHIDRIPIKRAGPRRPASTMTEPNFYSMPPAVDTDTNVLSITNPNNDDYTSQVPEVPSTSRIDYVNPSDEMTRIHPAMYHNLPQDNFLIQQSIIADQTLRDYNALLSRNRAFDNASDLLYQTIRNENIQRIASNLDRNLDNLSSYTTAASLLGRPLNVGHHQLLQTLTTPRIRIAALTNGLDISSLLARPQQEGNTLPSTDITNLYDLPPQDPLFDLLRNRR